METIRKAALGIFKDKKILMVRNADQDVVFYTLGGRLENGEGYIECLQREIKEETGCDLDVASIIYLSEFEAPAHGRENARIHIKLYTGSLIGEPKPMNEVAEFAWFDSSVDPRHLTQSTHEKIFPWLKENKYIN